VLSSPSPVEEFVSDRHQLPVPTRLVPDGVDIEVFYPAGPEEGLRERLSLPRDKKIVGYLGLLNEYQGVGVLLSAAKAVLDERDDAHFLVMGYPKVEHYRRRAEELGIADHVTFTGRLPYASARDYLAACDVGVSAKQDVTEANGKLLDYMAVGIPVVASDTAVNRALLGEDGVYGTVDDPAAIARALLQVLGDEEQARDLGRKLRLRAVAELSWTAGGEILVDLYRELGVPVPSPASSEGEASGDRE
jgi:glycosyltransferase involved in cell wall biosynthesis